MSALSNARHERFSQERAKGKTADEAYVIAGFRPHRGNAARLSANESVRARVAEIQERGAVRAEITVASITERLARIADTAECAGVLKDEDGKVMTANSQLLGVARQAAMDMAKVNGLIIDKAEVDAAARVAIYAAEPITAEQWSEKFAPRPS